MWDIEKGHEDFVTLTPSSNDSFTERLSIGLLLLKRLILHGKYGEDHVYSLGSQAQRTLANGITTILASVFPVLPIVILFFVHTLIVRLGLILVFTAVFAGILVLGLSMKPDKVLAITTA